MAARLPIDQARLQDICRRWQIVELALFGSVLTDRFRPESDVDVLVAFHPTARIGFIALATIQEELEALLGRPVDLVPKDGLKPVIRDHVLRQAEVLYAA
jgi:predicted nucleotidyltransferase